MYSPENVAFDIDGVLADTMTLFMDIAREEYGVTGLRYEDIMDYDLRKCWNLEPDVLAGVLDKIVTGDYTQTLKPLDGAAGVLTKTAQRSGKVLFVTARPQIGPLREWMSQYLSELSADSVDILAVGSHDDKAETLLSRNKSLFVDDRLETCFALNEVGIEPVLYKQPWNRKPHPFREVDDWEGIERLLDFSGV